jgi:biopolymer transport protein ExbD
MLFRKRKILPINSSSSADIAFLLLTFFLVTSSFDPKTGIYGKMKPLVVQETLKKRIDIQERNLLVFTIDANNRLIYNKEEIFVKNIRNLVKTFVSNPDNVDFLPEKKMTEIPEIGIYPVTFKHIISLEINRKSTYEVYLSVLGEISAAYSELRHEAARDIFHTSFERLTAEQKSAFQMIYPMRVAESLSDSTEKGGGHE